MPKQFKIINGKKVFLEKKTKSGGSPKLGEPFRFSVPKNVKKMLASKGFKGGK